jgi:hypothetical protein
MKSAPLCLIDCGTWGISGELAGIGVLPIPMRKPEPGFTKLVFSRRNVGKDMPLVDRDSVFYSQASTCGLQSLK